MDDLATQTATTTSPLATAAPIAANPAPQLSYDAAQDRTQKAAWALGLTSDSVGDAIRKGGEDNLRQHISSMWDQKTDDELRSKLVEAAENKGWALTTEDTNKLILDTARQKDFNKPSGVFEWATASKYLNTLYGNARSTRSFYDQLLTDFPREERVISSLGRNHIATQQYIQTQMENVQAQLGEQSTAGWLLDRGLAMVGYQDLIERGQVKGTGFFTGGMLGGNLESQRINLMRMPFPEQRDAIEATVKYMIDQEHSPATALHWLRYMAGQGNRFEEDAQSIISAIGLASGSTLVQRATKLMGNMVLATGSKLAPEVAANVSAGVIPKAAQASAAVAVKAPPIEKALGGLYDTLNVTRQKIVDEPNTNYLELRNRILEEFTGFQTKLNTVITDSLKIDQMSEWIKTPEAISVLRQQAEGKYGAERILGIGDPHVDPATGSVWFETRLGTPKAGYWNIENEAHATAVQMGHLPRGAEYGAEVYRLRKEMGRIEKVLTTLPTEELNKRWGELADRLFELHSKPGVDIVDDGLGFYISKWDSLNRDSILTRDLVLQAPEATTPKSSITDTMAALRTPGDTFSKSLFNAARVVSYAPGLFRALALDDLKVAKALRGWPGTNKREMYNNLEDMIRTTRYLRNEKGDLGWIPGVGELQNLYLQNFHREATPQEVSAFYAWSRNEGLQDALLRLQKVRTEANLGAEMFRPRSVDSQGNYKYGPWFVGIEAEKGERAFPTTTETIAYIPSLYGTEVLRPGNKFLGKRGKVLTEAVEKGTKRSVKALYPHDNPLKGYGRIGDESVITHVVGDLESKPLEVTPRPFRAWEHDAKYSIKQAIIKKDPVSGVSYYLGDRTIMHAYDRSSGKHFTDHLENIRALMAAHLKDPTEPVGHIGDYRAYKYATDNKIPVPFQEIQSWRDDGLLSLDKSQKLRLAPLGKRIADLDNSLKADILKDTDRFKDSTLSPLFRQEPDRYEIHQVQNKGSKTNPLWNIEESPRISPMASLNRSFQGILNSTYLNEFKNMAVQQWIRDAKQHLLFRQGPEEADQSPYHFFYNGQLKPGTSLADRSRIDGNRYKIKQILGTPGPMDNALHQIGQDLYDAAYEKGNPLYNVPAWIMDKTNDWSSVLRTIAYHATFSWNPVQIAVQSMNYATIAGLAGYKTAGIGSSAGFFHHFAKRNHEWVPQIGRMLENMGMKPGEFEEAFHALNRTGFQYVGKEHVINEGTSNKLISDGATQFLDMSSMFFNVAERNQRYAAWYTAWREFRDQHPSGAVSNQDIARVLGRADTLTGEMSSASKSMIQRGPLAFTTQFQGYSMRMTELLFGKRITPQAKFRTLATYAALFGVPATAGLSGTSLVSNAMRQKAIEHGYNPGEHWYSTLWNEGIPAYLGALATGNMYNVGSRYASFGFDLEEDKHFWDVAGGASFSMLKGAMDLNSPLLKSLHAMVAEDPKNRYTPGLSDINNALKMWSAYGKGVQLYTALATRDWVSRKGLPLEKDVGPEDATFRTFMGLQTQAIADLKAGRSILNARTEVEKDVENFARREYQNYFNASRNNDAEAMDASLKKIFSFMITSGYPVEKRAKLLGQAAASARESAVERQQRELGTKDVPTTDTVFRDRYLRRLELEKK